MITSSFGPRIIAGEPDDHEGTDFRAAVGEPIYSVADGIVEKVWRDQGVCDRSSRTRRLATTNGNAVRIRHTDGTMSGYAHLSRRYVNRGERVKGGQCIGLAGETGCVTGPHLHFSAFRRGGRVDPMTMIPNQGAPLANCRKPFPVFPVLVLVALGIVVTR